MAIFTFTRIGSQEKVDFTKNLAILLKSGVPINEALASLSTQTRTKAFGDIIRRAVGEVEKGTSLSKAFAREKRSLGGVFLGLLQAGEASGSLDENLSFLADWLERDHDLKEEVKITTLYPRFVLVAAVVLGSGLSVFILPRLVPLFEPLRVTLPWTTRALLGFSLFLQRYWWLAILGVLAIVFLFKFLNEIENVRRFFHRLYVTTPVIGSLVINYQLAIFSQLIGAMMKGGLAISEVLEIASEAVTNVCYQDSLQGIKERVGGGTPLSQAMRKYSKLYPQNMLNIIAVGEKSGTLDTSFAHLSDFYSKEVRNMTRRLPTIISPILLILIGVTVGFVALSIITPIYELTQGISY